MSARTSRFDENDDWDEEDLLDWLEEHDTLWTWFAMSLFGPVFGTILMVLEPEEPRRDRVFFGSWTSALVSAFGFGGALLDDAAYRALAEVEQAIAATVAVFEAQPLLIPSAFALLSVAGFAWSAVLYHHERGEA